MRARRDSPAVGQRRPLLRPHLPRGEAPRRCRRSPDRARARARRVPALRSGPRRAPRPRRMCLARCRSSSRSVNVALFRVSTPAPAPDRAPPPRWPAGSPRPARSTSASGAAHPHRPDMLLRHGARRVDPDVQPVLGEILVLVLAPERAPGRPPPPPPRGPCPAAPRDRGRAPSSPTSPSPRPAAW